MVCLILLLAQATPVMLVELKGSARAGKNLAPLSAAVAKKHTVVAPVKAPTAKALRAAAKAAGAELLVRVVPHTSYIQISIDWTNGGAIATAKLPAKKGRVTKKGVTQLLAAIDDAAGKLKTAAVLDEPDAPVEVAEPEPEPEPASDKLEELDDDEEYVEPEAKVVYTIKDGRRALTATIGYAMYWRLTDPTAADGTPPNYEGVLSPGLAFNASLFPRRWRDGGGALRNLGGYVRGWFSFMPTQLVTGSMGGPVTNSTAMTVHAGVVYRHIFGDHPNAIGLGAELGLVWDQVNVSADLPVPSTMTISPAINAILEVPFAKKRLVWASRFGVMPYSGVGAGQRDHYGTPGYAWGLHAASGFRSTFFGDYLFAEAQGIVTVYWERFKGTGLSGFTDTQFRDIGAGFQIMFGATY